MDPTEEIEQSDTMSTPMLLNSLEFPPLKSTRHPDTLTGTENYGSNRTNTGSVRAFSQKRHMKHDEEQTLYDERLSPSQNSACADSVSSLATSPAKKSRKFAYRDPPPVLQSLDADSFKTLFESPTLSDSQNSESELWHLSGINYRGPTKNTYSENLGSLGEIIQKYSTASLGSIKGFEISDPSISQTSFNLNAPDNRQNETITKTETFTLLTNTVKPVIAVDVPTNFASQFISSEKLTSAEVCQDKSDYEIRQSNLMSVSLDEECLSEVTVNHTSSMQVSKSSQSAVQSSYEKFVEHKKQQFSAKEVNKTKIKIKDSIVKEDKPKSEVDIPDFNDHDDDDRDDENEEEEYHNSTSEIYEGDPIRYQKCKKHKNHLQFYSIPDLQVRDLPEEIQHEDSVTFLSCLSQLVVQITVHSTSKARGPDDMYCDYIGTNKKRYGSGFISSVDEVIREQRCKRVECPHAVSFEEFSSFEDSGSMAPPSLNRSVSSANTSFDRSISNISTASSSSSSSCGGTGQKHHFYSGVRIHTNKHVIFDRSEAENAYVQFFYNTPEGREVVHGHVAAISGINNLQDHVILHVMSHDRSLFTTLDLCLHNAKTCYKQMLQSTHEFHQNPDLKHSWVAIVSHPHGLAKTITFGRVIKEVKEISKIIKYYDAATCPGSSGGLVITPSLLRLQWPGAVHSCTDMVTGYNVTFDSRFPDLDQKDMIRIHKTELSRKYSRPEDIFKL